MRKYWTAEEDAYLIKHYPENGARYCATRMDRTYDAIKSRTNVIGLRRTNVLYSEYEITIIRDYFPEWGVKKCKEFLPDRAEASIAKKANELGVRCDLIKQRQNLGLRTHDMPKGFYVETSGYLVFSPTARSADRMLHHRYVMEQHLGRKLRSDEIVHHKDEDKQNNDISNLEIMTRSQHASHHHGSHLKEEHA